MGLVDSVKKVMGAEPSAPEQPADADPALADLKARLSASHRPRGASKKPPVAYDTVDAQRKINELLSPKNIARIVKMPFETAFAVTGFEEWQLDQEEEAVLSTCWAVACQYLIPTMNPGLVALVIASINTTMITSKKAWLYRQEKARLASETFSSSSERPGPAKPDGRSEK